MTCVDMIFWYVMAAVAVVLLVAAVTIVVGRRSAVPPAPVTPELAPSEEPAGTPAEPVEPRPWPARRWKLPSHPPPG